MLGVPGENIILPSPRPCINNPIWSACLPAVAVDYICYYIVCKKRPLHKTSYAKWGLMRVLCGPLYKCIMRMRFCLMRSLMRSLMRLMRDVLCGTRPCIRQFPREVLYDAIGFADEVLCAFYACFSSFSIHYSRTVLQTSKEHL